MRSRFALLALSGLISTTVAALGPLPAAAAVPAGFADQLVASVASPTAMAFTPDGRLLVTTQGGTVRVVEDGVLLATPAITVPQLCSNSERGLLGVAVDPQFATNGFVFLYYSLRKAATCDSTTVNRVSRFVMTGNTLGSETVLIDNVPSPNGNHNAGDLQFGKDGLLYVSIGDGGCDYLNDSGCAALNDAARDRNVLLGKIARIDRNGNVPAGNPFTGSGTARCNTGPSAPGTICQETFAWGLRNPFRMAFDPNAAGTRFYINDVGQAAWEEIDEGSAGADYGWNVREGHCATGSTTNCGPPPAGMTNPIFDYGRSDGCRTITGGAFVPDGVWPAPFSGRYLFSDFGCGKIFRLDPNGSGGFTRTDFVTDLGGGSAVHLTFGPWRNTQALYYTSYTNGGQVRRIVHPAGTTEGDYDGDGDAEIGVFRPSTGTWFVRNGSPASVAWGVDGDVPVPGDYDGDGDTDIAVFRPSTGVWFVRGGSPASVAWGTEGDIPAPADYDGDGDTDIAVFRPAAGVWFIRGGSPASVAWGTQGDVPVAGDYDGDGAAEVAVFRPSSGTWFVRNGNPSAVGWGTAGDLPVPADYDGDGRTEIAVFRPSSGTWFVRNGNPATVVFGAEGDVPAPADYDGNASADVAVFRPSIGTWFVRNGTPSSVVWGTNGDRPLTAAP
ncbi:MAG TPA: PQQ-dependent sugar dehydrogenase [Acidimicrobiales bacterium]